jgi:hypothetical protein
MSGTYSRKASALLVAGVGDIINNVMNYSRKDFVHKSLLPDILSLCRQKPMLNVVLIAVKTFD